MCSGEAPELAQPESFVGRWLDILRPGYARIAGVEGLEARYKALEKQSVLVSVENLMTFPFVQVAVEAGVLGLHGMWVDIATGELQVLDGTTREFSAI
jgi:carbonic anhydrase